MNRIAKSNIEAKCTVTAYKHEEIIYILHEVNGVHFNYNLKENTIVEIAMMMSRQIDESSLYVYDYLKLAIAKQTERFKTIKEANHSETAVKTRVAMFHSSKRKLNLQIAYTIRDIKNNEPVEIKLHSLLKELDKNYDLMNTMIEMDEKEIIKLTIDNYTIENINKREKILYLNNDDSLVAVFRDYKLGTKKYKKDLIK